MRKVEPEITREEKIATLKISFYIFCLFVLLTLFSFLIFGYFLGLAGLIFLYIGIGFVAAAVGILLRKEQRIAKQNQVNLKKKASELMDAQKAALSIMGDLNRAKNELEKQVAERTAELEEAKANLGIKVADRTADLEKSKKAILHMMKDLKENMLKLQVVDRMKTEFLSMVSHELRTPITPIKGYLSLLLAGEMGEITPRQKEALGVLAEQSEHLQDLIDSLLDVSRLELGKPIPAQKEPLSVKELIKHFAEAVKPTIADRGLVLKLEIAEALPTVLADAGKLKRVISNLVGNAIKFTPKGGEIKIRAFQEKANVRVEVVDNGIGIAEEYLEKIFDKFYQVDSSYTRAVGGIGMGLAIVKELIGVHGGKIWAESEGLGKGSKFIFILPIGECNPNIK